MTRRKIQRRCRHIQFFIIALQTVEKYAQKDKNRKLRLFNPRDFKIALKKRETSRGIDNSFRGKRKNLNGFDYRSKSQ